MLQFPAFSFIFPHFPAEPAMRRTDSAWHPQIPADSRIFPQIQNTRDFRWFRILQNVDEMG